MLANYNCVDSRHPPAPRRPAWSVGQRRIARNQDKYVKLVWAVAKQCFMTSEQLCRLLPWIKNERTARHYTATAVANNLLARVPIRHAAVTCPAVYFVTSKGINFLKLSYFAKIPGKPGSPSRG